jgi:hypothetical protein
MKNLVMLIVLLMLATVSQGQQEGCTDRGAVNFNSEAVINDGSCRYRSESAKPKVLVRKLPDSVMETSGLIWWNDAYWTHNDSDNENAVYRLDRKTGKVVQRVVIQDAVNTDWEEIDHDDDYIYLGDFGNNLGNRRDLSILKIRKSDIPDTGDVVVKPETIRFRYGDQNDYTARNRDNDFDCEAMISYGDSLFLFTKNWSSLTCRLYAVPKNPGSYVLWPLDNMNTDGLVTGAAFDNESKRLVLCGYKNYVPFVWVLGDFWRNDFFGGNKRRIDFTQLAGAQTEGIAYTNKGYYAISAEKTPVRKAKIFKFEIKEID